MLVALLSVTAFAQKRMPMKLQPVQPKMENVLTNAGKIQTPRTLPVTSQAMPNRAAEDYPVITTQPEGELKTYVRSGGCYVVSNQSLSYTDQTGTIDIVFGADNKVYFKDIISGLTYGTWVEGVLSADGTTITVALDQNLRYVSNYDACIAIKLLKYVSGSGFSVDTEATEVTFTVADGVISLQGTGLADTSLAGVWTDDGTIQNYGDYESVYTPYTPNTTLVTLPEGLETVDMPMTGMFMPDVYADEGTPVSATVKVARDGNDFYIQGLAQLLPEAWVKGELDAETGEVEVPVTYLGVSGESSVYAMGYSSAGPVPIYLSYDAESGAMELDGYVMLSPSEVSLPVLDILGYYQALYIGEKPALVEVPEGLEIVEMPFTGTSYDGEASQEISGTVMVGVAETGEVYVQGLIQETPEGWIKGAFNEEQTQVVFPYGQYVGASEYGSVYAVGDIYDEETGNTTIGDIVFDYNASKNVFTATNVIYASGKKDRIYYYTLLANVVIGNECDEIWVAADQGYENATEITDFVIAKDEAENAIITGKADKAEGKYAPAYYTSGSALRLYAGNTLTITSEKEIGKIVFTMTGSAKQMTLVANVGDYTFETNTGTWTGQANEIVFTVPNVSGTQARIQKIKIFYFDASTTLVEAPEDLVTEPYQLKGTDTYYDEETSYEVKVGFVGNEVYFQGLSAYVPEAWVKGTLADGKVTIPNWYMGTYSSWFSDSEMVFSGATFTYDAETNTFTSEEGFQTIADGQYAMDEMANVVITKITETEATPADPEVTAFNGTSSYPNVRFNIPVEDTEGNALVSDKLSYVIWIEKDGFEQLLTLPVNLYTELSEDMTEIPYNFTDDYDIAQGGSVVYLNFVVDEMQTWTKIGIQSIYRGAGIEHMSNIGWYDLATYWQTVGIADIKADLNSGKAVIYNMAGQRVQSAQKGLYIVNGKKVVMK